MAAQGSCIVADVLILHGAVSIVPPGVKMVCLSPGFQIDDRRMMAQLTFAHSEFRFVQQH